MKNDAKDALQMGFVSSDRWRIRGYRLDGEWKACIGFCWCTCGLIDCKKAVFGRYRVGSIFLRFLHMFTPDFGSCSLKQACVPSILTEMLFVVLP